MNIVFTCGGTGGHIYPAIAVARLFQQRQPGCSILFIGAEDGMENKIVPREGFRLETLKISNFQRKLTPAAIAHNLQTAAHLSESCRKVHRILTSFRPDIVIGTGGYASFPALREGARLSIPTMVHESNAVPGLTTRMVEKYEILPEMLCFNENQEIILVYNSGKIHCNLGKDRLLEEKITRVAAILPKLTDFTGILHLEDYDTDITNIIFSKETLYTLKMEIAQIEGKDFSEETTDPGQDAATDPAADTADTEGGTAAQDAGSDPAASGEDTQDGDTQEDTAADGSDAGTTQDASGQEAESAGKANGASQSGADSSGTQQTAGE